MGGLPPGDTASVIDAGRVTLRSGGTIDAEFAVAGVMAAPALAEQALVTDRGVSVDAFRTRRRASTPRRYRAPA
jgi:hypothetical protein